jgi:hypothetical protein
MVNVLQNPPLAGQNISDWAKQQACRKTALETPISAVNNFDDWLVTGDEERASRRERRAVGVVDRGLDAIKQVLARDLKYWESLRSFCRSKRILLADDEKALIPACRPNMVPSDRQAVKLLQLVERAAEAGWQSE